MGSGGTTGRPLAERPLPLPFPRAEAVCAPPMDSTGTATPPSAAAPARARSRMSAAAASASAYCSSVSRLLAGDAADEEDPAPGVRLRVGAVCRVPPPLAAPVAVAVGPLAVLVPYAVPLIAPESAVLVSVPLTVELSGVIANTCTVSAKVVCVMAERWPAPETRDALPLGRLRCPALSSDADSESSDLPLTVCAEASGRDDPIRPAARALRLPLPCTLRATKLSGRVMPLGVAVPVPLSRLDGAVVVAVAVVVVPPRDTLPPRRTGRLLEPACGSRPDADSDSGTES